MTTTAERGARGGRSVKMGNAAVSASLRESRSLPTAIVDHLVATAAPGVAGPGADIDRDVVPVVRECVEMAASCLEGRHARDRGAYLRRAGARFAREGVPIDSIHHAIFDGLKFSLNELKAGLATCDTHELRQLSVRFIELLNSISTTIATAYAEELRLVALEHQSPTHALVTALFTGRLTATLIRECGVRVEESYFVVELTTRRRASVSAPVFDRQRIARLRAQLCARCPDALSLVGSDGGTLLIPESFGDAELDGLLRELEAAAGLRLTAAAMATVTADIPEARRQVNELLDLAAEARRGPGLYRFADLAVEYQLNRPGLGRAALLSRLRPLQDHPELLDTLRSYIELGFNAKATARALYVHQNTVRYRLKRVADLVGVDPTSANMAGYLQAAMRAASVAEHPVDLQRHGTAESQNAFD